MTIKTYESPNSVVANTTFIVGGKPRKVTFYPISDRMGKRTGLGSMFKTNDEKLQRAIEKSSMFGCRIILVKTEVVEDKPAADATGTGAEGDGMLDAEKKALEGYNASKDNGSKYWKVPKNEVTSPNDARAYLIENFKDVAPKSMPNIKAIINSGLRHGIVFECFEEEMKK